MEKKPRHVRVVNQGSEYAVQKMRPLTSEDLAVALPGSILGVASKKEKAYGRGLKVAVCSNGCVFRAPTRTIRRSLARLKSLPHNPCLYAWLNQDQSAPKLEQQVETGPSASATSTNSLERVDQVCVYKSVWS